MKRHCIVACVLLPVLAGCGNDTVDLNGQVNYSDGNPLPGAKVKVGSKAVVTTGADGKFSVGSVEVPYDLSAVAPDGSTARIFVGLTRKDPTILLVLADPSPAPNRSATMTGHISGSLFSAAQTPPQHVIAPAIDAPRRLHAKFGSSALDLSGNYTATLQWQGPASLSATFKALQFLGDANFNAISFDSAGSVPFTVTDGQTSSGVDMTLTAVRNIPLSGTVSAPPGYQLTGNVLLAAMTPNDVFQLGATSSANATFGYPAFSSPLMTATVNAFALDSSGTTSVSAWVAAKTDGSATAVGIPAGPVLRAPITASAGTAFSWSSFVPGAVYGFAAFPQSAGPSFEIVTSNTSFQMPDLSAMGFTLPRATSFGITLTATSPRTADDIAAGEDNPPRDHDGLAALTTGSFATSP